MGLLLTWLFSALALLAASYIVPGFTIDSFTTALLAAVVVGLLNMVIKPVLLLLTLPINLLTLGLFTFVVNAIVLWLASLIVPGMKVDGLLAGILASIVISLTSTVLSHLLKDIKK